MPCERRPLAVAEGGDRCLSPADWGSGNEGRAGASRFLPVRAGAFRPSPVPGCIGLLVPGSSPAALETGAAASPSPGLQSLAMSFQSWGYSQRQPVPAPTRTHSREDTATLDTQLRSPAEPGWKHSTGLTWGRRMTFQRFSRGLTQ